MLQWSAEKLKKEERCVHHRALVEIEAAVFSARLERISDSQWVEYL